MLTAAEIATLEHNINNVWSLADYLAYMNARARAEMAANPGLWVSEFTEELEHWNECGIHTARDLANYLDACFEKELRESDWDDFQEGQEAGLKAGAEEEERENISLREKYVEQPSGGFATLRDIWPS